MFQRLRTRALLPFLALLAAACSAGQADQEDLSKPRLGLFTSIPLYWGEGEIGTFIDGEGKSDWVRAELETRFELVPLDTLEQRPSPALTTQRRELVVREGEPWA